MSLSLDAAQLIDTAATALRSSPPPNINSDQMYSEDDADVDQDMSLDGATLSDHDGPVNGAPTSPLTSLPPSSPRTKA
jgi:hypothetical protein